MVKITEEFIETQIIQTAFFNAGEALEALKSFGEGEKITSQLVQNITICIITLKNGYSVIGQSACVDRAHYDDEIGRKLAKEDAMRKLWPIFGFVLSDALYDSSLKKWVEAPDNH